MCPPLAAQSDIDATDPSQFEEDRSAEQPSDQPKSLKIEQAEQAPEADLSPGKEFTVSSIIISGNRAMSDTEFVDLIEEYTSRPLTQQDLSTLATRVAVRARFHGYIFATATVPRQDLDLGVLRIELDEGRIDEVRLAGAQDPAIARQLAPLVSSQPVTKEELERRLLLADDISGVRILETSFDKEGSRGVLLVKTQRSNASSYVEMRNNGSRQVGPVRARIDVDFNGLISSGDEIDLSFGTTPLQPSELQFARGSYKIVVDASGLELGAHLSYSRTEPGAFLSDREIAGRFVRAGVSAEYPLKRRRELSLWVVGEFEVTDLEQDRFGELARRDRVPALRAGVYSRGKLADGWFSGRLIASRGLDILSATDPGDLLASRLDASARFSSLYGWFAWNRSLADSFSVALGARGQIASDPVLATEDIGLGGTSFLRGYDFNERSGDNGVMGFGELRYDWRGKGFWLPRGQAYIFADGGVVSNLEDGFGGGSLASAGGGVRLDLTRDLDLGVEVAVPLTGERRDSDSAGPLFNLRVGQAF
ncbi:ShlB/FhaC/HecB family hemolysin secretion/activation protein [uncultured Erythrobacter sp.]|uniref:ShlB/FhaC/HecB family hemolysin secretion/activation protein n=1 Tax=uncultured Erythrobacter sp. TaxID=263913 RepID=UPI00261F0584|nr:ShlB/FhaC/HecB family hemolysin secretion/activation protein [uncultured Erythrobacter sp.]